MSMMLSTGDIEFMKESVRDVINQWNTTITFLMPVSEEYQENFNPILREFTDDTRYDAITIQAERKDIVNNYTNDLENDDIYGLNDDGRYLYAIPNVIPVYDNGVMIGKVNWKPHPESIVVIDGSDDRYKILHIRDRIGETIIMIERITGEEPEIVPSENIPHDGLAEV